MGIEVKSIKCPNCSASLSVEEGRKSIFCSYCGSKIQLHDTNEYTVNIHDEAGVKVAETDQIVQLKKMEMVEKMRAAKEKRHSIKMMISIALGAAGIICIFLGYALDAGSGLLTGGMICLTILMYMWLMSSDKDDDLDVDFGDSARVPNGISDYSRKSYQSIEALFRGAGFTNIKSVPLNDITVGILKRVGTVESITINGKDVTSGGKKFPKDASVVITYHSSRL